jgi:hypothetical protein
MVTMTGTVTRAVVTTIRLVTIGMYTYRTTTYTPVAILLVDIHAPPVTDPRVMAAAVDTLRSVQVDVHHTMGQLIVHTILPSQQPDRTIPILRTLIRRAIQPSRKAPNFPKASTLPNNTNLGNLNRNNLAENRPTQRNNGIASSRAATNRPANRMADPARGFAKGNNPTGGRSGALGGYQPGGLAQASSARGKASFGGKRGGSGNGFGGGGGNRGGRAAFGGGGGNRGGGMGGRGGGGGNRAGVVEVDKVSYELLTTYSIKIGSPLGPKHSCN